MMKKLSEARLMKEQSIAIGNYETAHMLPEQEQL
jgi:hypothetical protein